MIGMAYEYFKHANNVIHFQTSSHFVDLNKKAPNSDNNPPQYIHHATPHLPHQSQPLTNILASRRLARAPTPLITTLIRRDLSRPRTSREDIWTTSLADVVEVARQARASIRVFAFAVDVAGGDVSVYMTTYTKNREEFCWDDLLPENALAVVV
jgi:hypothetical protein